MGLQIDIRTDGEGEVSVRARPYLNIAGVAVWQRTLHELPRHVCPLDNLRALRISTAPSTSLFRWVSAIHYPKLSMVYLSSE